LNEDDEPDFSNQKDHDLEGKDEAEDLDKGCVIEFSKEDPKRNIDYACIAISVEEDTKLVVAVS
jgi:hypothetical protein